MIGFAPWTWFVLAAGLAAVELLVPGVAFIWLAAAAAVTGVVAAVVPIGWIGQLALFAPLAVVAVIGGRRWIGRQRRWYHDNGLNRRGDGLVGRIVTVTEPLHDGRGKVMVGDSPWLAAGPDLPAGARVRVIALHGATLTVEQA